MVSITKIKNFKCLLNTYKEIFEKWRTADLEEILRTLSNTYYEYALMANIILNNRELDELNVEEKEEYMICKTFQERIIDHIIKLDGKEYFENFNPHNLILNPILQERISRTIHKAYWDNLQIELDSEPPVFTQLLRLIEGLRDDFLKFVPNRPDIQEEIKGGIDIDLLRNMITHDAFDKEDLYKLTTYIISLVKRFQPPVMDEKVEEWEQGMLNELECDIKYSDFLVIFFKSVFNMLDTIIHYFEVCEQELANEN